MPKSLSEFDFLELLKTKKFQNILTSDSELFKFNIDENNFVEIVALMPFDNFIERVIAKIESTKCDLVFISHVFFNSGMAVEQFDRLFEVCQKKEIALVIDCRLNFFLPTNFKANYLIQANILNSPIHHEEIKLRQALFREQLLELDHNFLCEKNILSVNYNYHGPFITFALPSHAHAVKLNEELKQNAIMCEVIENRLRFDFLLNEKFDLSFLKLK
jgi:hypothetical protein